MVTWSVVKKIRIGPVLSMPFPQVPVGGGGDSERWSMRYPVPTHRAALAPSVCLQSASGGLGFVQPA